MSLFTAVEMAPRDPILGLNEQFNADPNPQQGQPGRRRVLRRQRQAAAAAMRAGGREADDGGAQGPRLPAHRRHRRLRRAPSRAWCSAPTASRSRAGRVATVQGLGGTGGLKIGADFLKQLNPDAKVLISDPSWENHRALFTRPASRSRATPTTTRPSAASTSTACWPR